MAIALCEGYQHELRFEGSVIASSDTNRELRAYMQLALGLLSAAKLAPALVAIAGGLSIVDVEEDREAA